MRPIRVIKTGTGTTNAIPLDCYISPFNIGFGVEVSAGATVNYKVQHTFDNVEDSSITAVWFDHPTITGQTANADGNYAFPVAAVRLNASANDGTLTFVVIQAGIAS